MIYYKLVLPSSRLPLSGMGSSGVKVKQVVLFWTPGWLAPLLRGHRSDVVHSILSQLIKKTFQPNYSCIECSVSTLVNGLD